MLKTIREIKVGDLVMGTDGKWHKVIEKTTQKLAWKMYEITFLQPNNELGTIKCSDTHQWNVFINNKEYTIDTMAIAKDLDFYRDKHVGTKKGPIIKDIKAIPAEIVQCITTDAPDHQFAVYLTNKEVKS